MRFVLIIAGVLGMSCDVYDRPNRPVPESFRAQLLGGAEIDGGYFKGKPWIVALWVPGCGKCAREMPELEQVRRDYERQGLGFLALSLEPEMDLVAEAAERLGIDMPVAVALTEVLAPMGVNQVPSTVFIDSDGVIVAAVSGERRRPFFARRAEALLARALQLQRLK